MLNPAGIRAWAHPPVVGPADGGASARPASPAEQVLVDFLEMHLALQPHLGFDGTAGVPLGLRPRGRERSLVYPDPSPGRGAAAPGAALFRQRGSDRAGSIRS
ncbi:hypothetical protein SPARM206S_00410 [Streptomyces parvulus]